MSIAIAFVLGLLIGGFIGFFLVIWTRYFPVGFLHCDRTDPDGPYLFLELIESLDEVDKRNYVCLKVDHNHDMRTHL